jgi:photosystem II stability/assembly factor-like uncharacterized protein
MTMVGQRAIFVSFFATFGLLYQPQHLAAQPVPTPPRPLQRDRMRVPIYPPGLDPAAERMKALEQMERMKAELQSSDVIQQPWTDIGPRPTVCTLCANNVHWGAWTDSLAVDPTNSQTVYIGNPGGGVWRTTDGGTNWSPMTDNGPSLEIGSIAIAPSNPSVVYAGTGDGDYGVGVLKSTDSGNTWTLLPGPFKGPFGPNQFWDGGFFIVALAVHPQNPNVVLAGTFQGNLSNRGIWRSLDGGNTWTQVFSNGVATSLTWNPQNANIVYAAIGEYYSPANNGIYKSTDGGATWTLSENGVAASLFTSADNIRLSISASNPNVIYASLPGITGSTLAVLKTTDGGVTWTQLPMPTASRAFQIIVHPQYPNIVFVGDVVMYRSIDGGQTWTSVSAGANGVYLFGDFRSLGYSSDGSVLYVGDDGGVWKTFDAASATINWTPLNDTQERTLFYPGLSIHPTDPTIGFGGAQDLGILKYSGTKPWQHVQGCDGGTTLIDQSNPQNTYATCNGISIYRSTAGGAAGTWTSAITGINTADGARFIPTMAMDPENPQRLLYGTDRIYQSLDGALSWVPISANLTGDCFIGIPSISISPTSNNTVYVGACSGAVYVSTNAMAASPTWTNRSSGLPNDRDLTRVVADLADPLTAYVTISGFTWTTSPQGHVFRTHDGGMTWTDISGNLPNIPANGLAIDPDLPGTLYVATDIGVFWTSNGGAAWAPLGTGLPHTYAVDLRIHRPSRLLRVATQGRGMWDLPIAPGASGPPDVHIDVPTGGATISDSFVIAGWAIDNTNAVGTAINVVQVAVDGMQVGTATYGLSRPDVCNAYPGRSGCPNVGFSYNLNTVALTPGQHSITVSATDTDPSPHTGSSSVTVTLSATPPTVHIDAPVAGSVLSDTATVSGWALDNSAGVGTAIASVQVKVDGTTVGNATYGASRPDVCNAYPGRVGCPNVGFTFQLNLATLSAGSHTITVSATDSDGTPDIGNASVSITVADAPPNVYIDSPTPGTVVSAVVAVTGWALDTTSAIGTTINSVQVKVDGLVVGTATYGTSRPDVCNAYPGRVGCPNVGFTFALNTASLSPGSHLLTVTATDNDVSPDAGSWSVTFQVAAIPSLRIDLPAAGSTVFGIVTVAGWAIDNVSGVGTAISSVQVKVDGVTVGTASYGANRPDVCAAYPGRPGCPSVGYSYPLNTAALTPGQHTITVAATDSDAIPDVGSATISVTVASAPPTVYIDIPANNGTVSGTVTVAGWAIDSITAVGTAISSVQVKVDGTVVGTATYGVSRPDVCAAYAGRPGCPNVGYTFQLNTAGLSSGPHTLTVTATDSDGTPDTGSASITIVH